MTVSPFTRRALSRQLPPQDYTGRVRPSWDEPTTYAPSAERITVGPGRRSFTVADLQRRVGENA